MNIITVSELIIAIIASVVIGLAMRYLRSKYNIQKEMEKKKLLVIGVAISLFTLIILALFTFEFDIDGIVKMTTPEESRFNLFQEPTFYVMSLTIVYHNISYVFQSKHQLRIKSELPAILNLSICAALFAVPISYSTVLRPTGIIFLVVVILLNIQEFLRLLANIVKYMINKRKFDLQWIEKIIALPIISKLIAFYAIKTEK